MEFLIQILLIAPPILFAITIHEFSHGWIADKLGDPTARHSGRLTLNPLAHLDPIGTLMLFIVHIGWAKPVPVNPENFANPRKSMFWVGLAGPASNLIAAFIFGMMLRWIQFFPQSQMLAPVMMYVVLFNLILAIFNLIPIPPLDGYNILLRILPIKHAYNFSQFARIGPFILLGIIVIGEITKTPILLNIISPLVRFFSVLFTGQDFGF